MKHYLMSFLEEQKPDVIDVTGNDSNYKNKDNVNVNELADQYYKSCYNML